MQLVEVGEHEKWTKQHAHTLGPLHIGDWEHVTITLQALSLVDKEEPI